MNDEETEDYFSDAAHWASDQELRQQRTIRMVWIFAAIAGALAILEAIIILVLLPLKTVEPVTLLVDRTTGFVQAVDPGGASTIRADEALTQSLLAQYVTARERYDRATVRSDYQRAALWSSGKARQAYLSQMSTSNTAGPTNRYQSGENVVVKVKSVSKIDQNSAFVRFDTSVIDRSGTRLSTESWVSLVKYQFSNAPMSYEDRLINPLGLQVSEYRRDAERPDEAPSVVEPVGAPGQFFPEPQLPTTTPAPPPTPAASDSSEQAEDTPPMVNEDE